MQHAREHHPARPQHPTSGPTPEQRAALVDLYLFRRRRSPGQRFESIAKQLVKK